MSDFTPTTEQVRDGFRFDPEDEWRDPVGAGMRAVEAGRAFDRWLAAHDAELRAQIATELRSEAARAREAYRSAQTNYFAHDYCRWVGHAEALASAAARITRGEKP